MINTRSEIRLVLVPTERLFYEMSIGGICAESLLLLLYTPETKDLQLLAMFFMLITALIANVLRLHQKSQK